MTLFADFDSCNSRCVAFFQGQKLQVKGEGEVKVSLVALVERLAFFYFTKLPHKGHVAVRIFGSSPPAGSSCSGKNVNFQ